MKRTDRQEAPKHGPHFLERNRRDRPLSGGSPWNEFRIERKQAAGLGGRMPDPKAREAKTGYIRLTVSVAAPRIQQ